MSDPLIRYFSAINAVSLARRHWPHLCAPAWNCSLKRLNGILIAAMLFVSPLVLCGCDADPTVDTVKQTSDQALLAKIAVEAKKGGVRRAAVEKLTDQDVLAKIAIEEKNDDVRRAAGRQVTDQALLARIAVEAKDVDIRRAAVEKLTGQEVLAKIAIKDEDRDVRRAAAGKLTDEGMLGKVAAEAGIAGCAALLSRS